MAFLIAIVRVWWGMFDGSSSNQCLPRGRWQRWHSEINFPLTNQESKVVGSEVTGRTIFKHDKAPQIPEVYRMGGGFGPQRATKLDICLVCTSLIGGTFKITNHLCEIYKFPKYIWVKHHRFSKKTQKSKGFFCITSHRAGCFHSFHPSFHHTAGWQLGQKLEPLGKFTSTPFKAWTLVTRRDFCCSKQGPMGPTGDILEKKGLL